MAEEYNLQEIIAEEQPQLKFDSLPIWKLVLFEILSFGLYDLAWYYTQNKALKKRHPLLETIFYPYTCFWLFPKINKHFKLYNKSIPSILFSIIVLICAILSNITTKIELRMGDEESLPLMIADFFLLIIPVIPLVITQKNINEINLSGNTDAQSNKWTWKSTVFMIIFVPLFLLCMLGYILSLLEIFGIINLAD